MDSKATTVLTNLQRGNIEAKVAASAILSFFERCGQGRNQSQIQNFFKYFFIIFLNFLGEIEDEDLKSFPNINQPDDENLFTPLHWSCHYGQLRTTEKLLKYGANPNSLAKNYISPLHLAAAGGHHEIVKLLITKNAKVDHLDVDGNSPLHFAAFGNFPHSVNEILQSGCSDVMRTNGDGKTAYHLAVENKAHLAQAVIENFISSAIN